MKGFLIWVAVGIVIVGIGIRAFFLTDKPIGFWANVQTMKVKDIKGYNKATGMLLVIFGVIYIILGLPLLAGQNNALILLSAMGVMIESIIAMAIYSVCITKKYEDKR